MTTVQNFDSDFTAAAQWTASGEPGNYRTTIVLGPDPVAVIVSDLAIIHGLAYDLGLTIKLLSDPTSTPDAQCTIAVLDGTREQTSRFNEALAEARAS